MQRFPLFRLNFNGKTSYLLGTNHWCPLVKLEKIHNIILNKKTLIVEMKPHFYINSNPLKLWDPIKNFSSIKNYQIDIKKENFRKIYNPNIVKIINSPQLNILLDNIIYENLFLRFWYKSHDFNTKFILKLITLMFYMNGVDHQLISYYRLKNKKILELDNSDEEYKNILIFILKIYKIY